MTNWDLSQLGNKAVAALAFDSLQALFPHSNVVAIFNFGFKLGKDGVIVIFNVEVVAIWSLIRFNKPGTQGRYLGVTGVGSNLQTNKSSDMSRT